MKKTLCNIQLFADGAGTGAGAAAEAGGSGTGVSAENMAVAEPRKGQKAGALSNVIYGKTAQASSDDYSKQNLLPEAERTVATKQEEEKAVAFENLIKGDYKEEFNSRVDKIVKGRLGDTKRLEQQAAELEPVMKLLAGKYGVDAGDYTALAKAIQEDSSYYEAEAASKGVSVEQLKEIKRLENDNQQLREAARIQEEQRRGQEIYGNWMNQAEELKTKYGLDTFDFAKEAENKDFISILRSGGTVEAAYLATHFDEMLGGAMAATASNVSKKLASNIASRNARPTESAVSSQPGVIVKSDVSKFTKEDRREIMRRVERGETINL